MHLLTRGSGWICRAAAEPVQRETGADRASVSIRQRLMRNYCLGCRREETRLSCIAAMIRDFGENLSDWENGVSGENRHRLQPI